jgi:CRP-like cAMP-binding protein
MGASIFNTPPLGKASVEQRLARWPLICVDRAHSNCFPMSQDFLADMLGNTRPTVSTLAAAFKEQDLIKYNRGMMQILDPARLEE